MAPLKITEDLRRGLNNYTGIEYIRKFEVGHELTKINRNMLAKIPAEKVKLLIATLFPEKIVDKKYLLAHKEEIFLLAKNLHIKKQLVKRDWTHFMIRKEEGFNETLDDTLTPRFFRIG